MLQIDDSMKDPIDLGCSRMRQGKCQVILFRKLQVKKSRHDTLTVDRHRQHLLGNSLVIIIDQCVDFCDTRLRRDVCDSRKF